MSLLVFLFSAAFLAIAFSRGGSKRSGGMSTTEREILSAIGLREIPANEIIKRMSRPVPLAGIFYHLDSLKEKGLIEARWVRQGGRQPLLHFSVTPQGIIAYCGRGGYQ